MPRSTDQWVPDNVKPEVNRSWVTPDGLGICGECVYDAILKEKGVWYTEFTASRAFVRAGYERTDDEFCSVCDRDTVA
jgi:hypothetical protein